MAGGGEAHSLGATIHPVKQALHLNYRGEAQPRVRTEAQSFHGNPRENIAEVEKMKRALLLTLIFLMAMAVARSVAAVPQRRGSSTLSGVVLGPDDYDLRASGKGVFSEWEKNIPLRSGETKDLTLRLIYAKEVPKAYVKSKPKQ